MKILPKLETLAECEPHEIILTPLFTAESYNEYKRICVSGFEQIQNEFSFFLSSTAQLRQELDYLGDEAIEVPVFPSVSERVLPMLNQFDILILINTERQKPELQRFCSDDSLETEYLTSTDTLSDY